MQPSDHAAMEAGSPELEGAPVWDDQALVRALGYANPQVQQRMLLRFAAHTGPQLQALGRLCEEGDFHAIGLLAHNAKTAARTVGAMRLGQWCDLLESSCNDGDAAAARRQVEAVLRAYEAIQTYLPQPSLAP